MSQPTAHISAPSNVEVSAPPSNAQVVQGLDKTAQVLKHEKETNPNLDQRGKEIATTAENLIQTSKQLLQDKNGDEKFQKFVNHCMTFGEKLKAQKAQQVSNQEIQQSMDQLSQLSGSFQNLIKQMVMSAEYRSMFMQLIESVDKIVWGVAHRQNEKSSVGQSALQGGQHSASHQQTQQTQQTAFPTAQHTTAFPQPGADLSATHTGAIVPPTSHVGTQVGTHTGQQPTVEQAKQVGQELANEVSEEEKREVAHNILNILSKMGRNPEWREASNNILGLFDFFRAQQQQAKDQAGGELREEMKQLYREGVVVVQDIGGLGDVSPLEHKFWDLYKIINEDQESRQYFHQLREWANRVLSHPESVDDKEVVDESSRLINQGYSLIRAKYSQPLREITHEFSSLLNNLQTNEYTKQYQQHLQAFQETLRTSPFETLSQARHLMFPLLKELMDEFPLPRVEGTTENGKYTIDNMVLKGKALNLDDIIVDMRFGLKDVMVLTLRIRGISAGIKSGNFTYNSSGLMSWNDAGTFDATIASPEWKVKWMVVERNDLPMRLEISKIDVRLKTFNITIEEAKHKILDRMFLGLFTSTLKKKAEESLEKQIREKSATLGEKFNGMFFPSKQATENPPLPAGSFNSPLATGTAPVNNNVHIGAAPVAQTGAFPTGTAPVSHAAAHPTKTEYVTPAPTEVHPTH